MALAHGPFKIVPFHKHLNRGGFDCGVVALNDYLAKQANQDLSRNVCRVYCLISEKQSSEVIGYYTLSVGSVALLSFTEEIRKKLPKYPIPIALIGRLAVDRKCQGKGWGKTLLMHALDKIAQVSREVGIFAVVLDAKDDQVKAYYAKFGFIPFVDQPLKLFLPIDTILKLYP